jgi:hypothetical protein
MRNILNFSRGRITLGLVAVLGLAGCAAPPTQAVALAAAKAHLSVVNLTNYAWRLALTGPRGGEARDVRVEPRSSVELELAGGDYQIEQAMLTSPESPESVRRFSVRLDAAQTYRWPLATLMTGAEDEGGGARSGGAGR